MDRDASHKIRKDKWSKKVQEWYEIDNDSTEMDRRRWNGFSDLHCARCHHQLYKNSGYFFRPRNKNRWMAFCRIDCAYLAIQDDVNKLMTFEQYINRLITRKQ